MNVTRSSRSVAMTASAMLWSERSRTIARAAPSPFRSRCLVERDFDRGAELALGDGLAHVAEGERFFGAGERGVVREVRREVDDRDVRSVRAAARRRRCRRRRPGAPDVHEDEVGRRDGGCAAIASRPRWPRSWAPNSRAASMSAGCRSRRDLRPPRRGSSPEPPPRLRPWKLCHRASDAPLSLEPDVLAPI